MNIADMRTVHSREAFEALREHFGDKVFETVIRSSIAYAESAERAARSSSTAPTSAATTSRWPTRCSPRIGLTGWRRKLAPLLRPPELAMRPGQCPPAAVGARARPITPRVAIPAACLLVSAAVAGCAGATPPRRVADSARDRARAAARGARRTRRRAGRALHRVRRPARLPRRRRRGRLARRARAERPNGRTGWIGREHAVLGSVRWSITLDRSARRLELLRGGARSGGCS